MLPHPAHWGIPTCQDHCLPGPCWAGTDRSLCARLEDRCWTLDKLGESWGLGTDPADLGVESALCNPARVLKNRELPRLESKPDYQTCTNVKAKAHITSMERLRP